MSWTSLLLLACGIPGLAVGWIVGGEAWMGLEPGILLIFAAMGFVVGSFVGSRRGRTWQGAWAGLVLGAAGWLIVAMLPMGRSA